MKFLGTYIKKLFIHSFVAGILAAIAGAIHPAFGGFILLISCIGVFLTALDATKKELGQKPQAKTKSSNDKNTIDTELGTFTIKVTSSYDDDDDDDYDYEDETYDLVSPDDSISISEFQIEGALLYVNNKGTKSSICNVIPQKLKVSEKGNRGDIGYWPSYSDIKPGHRYDYLKWLSEGREDPDLDTGLVFLFFYGLEWRIIKDKKDYEWVAKEVLRLMTIYTNNSFQNYSKSLLTYITFQGIKKLTPETLEKIKAIAQEARPYSTMGESGLLMFIEGTSKVTPEVLFSQIPNFEDVSRSKVPTKVGHLFKDHLLFLIKDKVDEYCLKGSIVKNVVHYYSASGSVGNTHFSGKFIKVPKTTQNALAKKWNQAIEDLRKYSTRMDKDSKEKLYTLLPDNLKQNLDHPLAEQLKQLFKENAETVIKFGKIAEMCGYPFKEKYTLKESCTVSDILADTKVALEPEPNYFRKSFKYDDTICVYKDENTKLEGPTYSTVAMLLDLGVALAYADGEYDESEARTVEKFIIERFCLSNPELEVRATKRLKLYNQVAPKTTGLLKKLSERLKVKELSLIGNFLFDVAIADGQFDISEEKYLKKTFKGLGIEELYESSLSKFSSYIGNTTLKASGQKSSPKEAIPVKNISPVLSIDKARLAQLEDETKQVQSALAEIFIEEESQPVVEEIIPPIPLEATSLSKEENSFLQEVLKHGSIGRDKMREIAKNHGFMPGPVIEKINEWAEAQHGDFLIFDEGDYIIEQSLMQEEAKSA